MPNQEEVHGVSEAQPKPLTQPNNMSGRKKLSWYFRPSGFGSSNCLNAWAKEQRNSTRRKRYWAQRVSPEIFGSQKANSKDGPTVQIPLFLGKM